MNSSNRNKDHLETGHFSFLMNGKEYKSRKNDVRTMSKAWGDGLLCFRIL